MSQSISSQQSIEPKYQKTAKVVLYKLDYFSALIVLFSVIDPDKNFIYLNFFSATIVSVLPFFAQSKKLPFTIECDDFCGYFPHSFALFTSAWKCFPREQDRRTISEHDVVVVHITKYSLHA